MTIPDKPGLGIEIDEVEFERNVYETVTEEGEKRYEYLLDKGLGLSQSGFFSELMSELIAKRCCESSYRNAAQAVSDQTGQTLSHTAHGMWYKNSVRK